MNERYEQVSLFFSFFRNSFIIITVSFTKVIKRSPDGELICRWRRVVDFEIHLCSSGVNSDLGECFFWGLCKPVIATTDL